MHSSKIIFQKNEHQFASTACGLLAEPPSYKEDESTYELLGDYELTEELGSTLDKLEKEIKKDFQGSYLKD